MIPFMCNSQNGQNHIETESKLGIARHWRQWGIGIDCQQLRNYSGVMEIIHN